MQKRLHEYDCPFCGESVHTGITMGHLDQCIGRGDRQLLGNRFIRIGHRHGIYGFGTSRRQFEDACREVRAILVEDALS